MGFVGTCVVLYFVGKKSLVAGAQCQSFFDLQNLPMPVLGGGGLFWLTNKISQRKTR